MLCGMPVFYLIRHGTNDLLPHTLAGRMPGVHLNEAGRRQAEQLAAGLQAEGIQRIYSSPLERCRETAEPLADKLGLRIEFSDALLEVDFGQWTGQRIAELEPREDWRQWNLFRSGSRAPAGETMLDVQARMVAFVNRLRDEFPEQRIAVVGHADPLRTLVLHYLGVPSEFIRRIDMSPASATVLAVDRWDAQLRCLNLRFGAERLRA
jgi:broad specificity phosphatase PhoE